MRFQSALRSGERSDRRGAAVGGRAVLFQSALRSGERSDRLRHHGLRNWQGFNPRSARVSGATFYKKRFYRHTEVSIRAPLG